MSTPERNNRTTGLNLKYQIKLIPVPPMKGPLVAAIKLSIWLQRIARNRISFVSFTRIAALSYGLANFSHSLEAVFFLKLTTSQRRIVLDTLTYHYPVLPTGLYGLTYTSKQLCSNFVSFTHFVPASQLILNEVTSQQHDTKTDLRHL